MPISRGGIDLKKSTVTFKNAKAEGKKLTMLTAYDYAAARLLDACDIDGILVGDSLGMVCLGYKDTLSVTMEDMIHHTKAVAKGVKNALLVADMPHYGNLRLDNSFYLRQHIGAAFQLHGFRARLFD